MNRMSRSDVVASGSKGGSDCPNRVKTINKKSAISIAWAQDAPTSSLVPESNYALFL